MQLKLSLVTASLLTSLMAEDYVSLQYLQYDENDNKVSVSAPSLEVNKDFGLDYTLNTKLIVDSVSGATSILTDTSSGASAFSRSESTNSNNIKKQNVEFTEQRSYIGFSLLKRFDKSRDELTTSLSRSYESDYESVNIGFDYLHWLNESKNTSINFGLSYQMNEILIKECTLNYQCADSTSSASEKMDSSLYSLETGVTQIIDKSSLIKANIFYSNEDGYLSNPYYNVARDNYTKLIAEIRPNKRTSYGFNLKYFKSLNSKFDYNLKYKYYTDDWDINSHTIDLNTYYKFTKKFILGLGLRYYNQSEAKFYNNKSFDNNEKYASSDERLSSFDAITYKTNFIYKANKKIEYNLSYNMYEQSTDLKANYMGVGLKYKF